MKKLEKLLITFITWVYVGIVMGLVLGALFGGRGGFYIVEIAFLAGCVVGLLRTVYLGFTYNEKLTTQSTSKTRVIARRVFVGLLYAPILYAAAKYLDPAVWNNPYTYEWGEATDMYLSRDGQVVVPRTIIDMKNVKGHYYGLRMSIDIYNCSASSTRQFSNRRWYFILPIAEDKPIEFSNKDEFEAELKIRIPSGVDELDYDLFQEKWDYYSAIYAKRERTDCVIEEGA